MDANAKLLLSLFRERRMEVKTYCKPIAIECFDAASDQQTINKLSEYICLLVDLRNAVAERSMPGGTIVVDHRKAGDFLQPKNTPFP